MRTKILLFALLVVGNLGIKAAGSLSNVEAMYIYNFLRHVNWPETNNSEIFIIGVMGDNEAYAQLTQYTANRKVGTKSIVIKKIESVEEAAACQLVFVPTSKSQKVVELKNRLGNKPCLIVSEKEGSNAVGSTIEFVIEGDKLKFRINEERAKQQNLVVSRALLDMSV
jgi:hypothetical protein